MASHREDLWMFALPVELKERISEASCMARFHDSLPKERLTSPPDTPKQFNIISDVVAYFDPPNGQVSSLKRRLQEDGAQAEEDDGPAGKRQKTQNEHTVEGIKNGTAAKPITRPAIEDLKGRDWEDKARSFQAPDISFLAPSRKKLRISLVPGSSPSKLSVEYGGIMIEAPSGTFEDNIKDGMNIGWADFETIICTPVPEKAAPAYNFTIIPSSPSQPHTSHRVPKEPYVFTVPQAVAKDVRFFDSDNYLREGETWEQLFLRLFDAELRRLGKRVTVPDPKEFQSAMVQAHRKGEKAYHVKAFRGASEGFLFFLSTGILFGYKKPILFFPLHSITSTSYSSVLQRTFNLNVSVQLRVDDSTFFIKGAPPMRDDPPRDVDFEFSMIDQADHGGIDAYVKGHGLQDASLAEGRRAKRYNVNKQQTAVNGGPVSNGVGEPVEEGESELAKAERELQDAEDEEEEDFDPSGGESDGSGMDSEEEEDDGDEAESDEEEDDGEE